MALKVGALPALRVPVSWDLNLSLSAFFLFPLARVETEKEWALKELSLGETIQSDYCKRWKEGIFSDIYFLRGK